MLAGYMKLFVRDNVKVLSASFEGQRYLVIVNLPSGFILSVARTPTCIHWFLSANMDVLLRHVEF